MFRTLRGASLTVSLLVLTAILLVTSGLGMLIHRKNRCALAVAADVIIGYGLYTAITYFEIKPKQVLRISIFTAAAIAIYCLYLAVHCLRRRAFTKGRIKGYLSACRRVSFCFLTVGMVAILSTVGLRSVLTFGIAKSSAATANDADETIANNMQTLIRLEEETWHTLTVDERLDVLQTVANIEARYLGLPNHLTVYAVNADERNLGSTNQRNHVVMVNVDSVLNDSPWEVVNTIAHEAYHDYQQRLVEVYEASPELYQNLRVFRPAQIYREEFAHYVSDEEDFDLYYQQRSEADARAYAEDAVDAYISKILAYLGSAEN